MPVYEKYFFLLKMDNSKCNPAYFCVDIVIFEMMDAVLAL